MWTEEELADSESAMGKRENHAVRLKWKDTKAAYYEIALDEPMAMGEGGICFDAMDLREKAENEPMDFSVVLTDIHGNRAVSTYAILRSCIWHSCKIIQDPVYHRKK